ncbi:MAG: iron export ABC transporter permease subunit FetB [Planctomycetes bacterium]|nr:iron export ABC transporter permease subunit FetB [Planctomycetota bacterium]NOG53813.1 iron export ABC transporter permease subunit FetB [Planctomycetota bacterium]
MDGAAGGEAVGALALGPIDLAIAAALVLVAGAISLLLRLHLEQRLIIAALRTVVQLLLIGYVLRWVFALDRPAPVLIVMLLMITAAAYAAVTRPSRTYDRAWVSVFITLIICASLTTLVVTGLIIGVTPWYQPQYLIPLLGMVLGNSLTGVSLALDHVLDSLVKDAPRIEMMLSLGASRWEAARDSMAEAVRRGMIPIINAMTVVGIVSLPGMMTGQILAGANPVEAVKYQIVVMFMIAAATSAGCMMIVLLAYRRLFTSRHQLNSGAIRKR